MLFLVLACWVGPTPLAAQNDSPASPSNVPPPSAIQARSALLFDARTGRVLWRKNENDPMPVASTQKLLTALLVIERGGLDEMVTVEPSDTLAAPTKLYLKAGEQYTRRQLLHGLIVRSFNDVAAVLARDHSGSEEAFAEAMNHRVRRLGGRVSNFTNAHGLPHPEQISTAREIGTVARAAYFNRELREMMNLQSYAFRRNNGTVKQLRNTNRVLRTMPECNGMKTGYTRLSGHCLIASASRNGHHVISVVLGSNKARVWGESENLLRYGLDLLENRSVKLSGRTGGN